MTEPTIAELCAPLSAKPKPEPDEFAPAPAAPPKPKQNPNTRHGRGAARKPCTVPGCNKQIIEASVTGVCRAHNHHLDRCMCSWCQQRRAKREAARDAK